MNHRKEDIVWGLGLGCNGPVDVFIQPATEVRWRRWPARWLVVTRAQSGDSATCSERLVGTILRGRPDGSLRITGCSPGSGGS